jgi:hypothetical protein
MIITAKKETIEVKTILISGNDQTAFFRLTSLGLSIRDVDLGEDFSRSWPAQNGPRREDSDNTEHFRGGMR